MRMSGLTDMILFAASFITGMWAVPPAMSRLPFWPLKASRGAAIAEEAAISIIVSAIETIIFFIIQLHLLIF